MTAHAELDNKHVIVVARGLRAPPRTPEAVTDWLGRLVPAIGMQVLMAPRADRCDDPGNEGCTGGLAGRVSPPARPTRDDHGMPIVHDHAPAPSAPAAAASVKIGEVVIKTSHAVIHVWDGPGVESCLQFDLYSCADFNPYHVAGLIVGAFDPERVGVMTIDRNGLMPRVIESWECHVR